MECRRLFAYVATLPDHDWWMSLLLTVYWSGCRIGALMGARAEDYRSGIGLAVRRPAAMLFSE